MAGDQDQPKRRVLPARGRVSVQGGGLLALHRAARHEDDVRRGEAQHPAKLAGPGVVPVALEAVEFHRAGDADPILRHTQLDEPAGVLVILRRDGVDLRQRRLQQDPQPSISPVAARAEPGIDDGDLGPRPLGRVDQVGPELELDECQHGRPDPLDRPLRRPTEVQRGVEGDEVGIGAACDRQPRGRRRGDHDLPPGTAAGHLADQGPEQQDLADTHRVEPEAGLVADPDGGVTPELLVPTFAVLARAGPSEDQERREEEEGGHVDHIQRQRHLGESFPGMVPLLSCRKVPPSRAIAVPRERRLASSWCEAATDGARAEGREAVPDTRSSQPVGGGWAHNPF